MFLSKRNNKIYYLYYRDFDGIRRKVTTKSKTKKSALKFLNGFNLRGHNGDKESLTFKQFQFEYLKYTSPILKPKSILAVTSTFKFYIKYFGNIQINKLSTREIESIISHVIVNTSIWSAKKYYSVMRAAFNKALSWELIESNPFSKIKPPKTPELNHIIFTKDDFKKLIGVTEQIIFKDIFTFAVLTGMRLQEILNLKWEHIDLIKKVIHIVNTDSFTTKNHKNRKVPINIQLLEILKPTENKQDYIFTFNNKKINGEYLTKTFKRSVRKAGLNDRFHFHSLRHTFATWMIESNVNIYAVSKILGHQSVTTTQKFYANVNSDVFNEEINKINL